MNNLKVTKEIKMEIIKYFTHENDEEFKEIYLNEVPDDLFKHYYYCMYNGLDLIDADEYAVLNTLFGYDIGIENAGKINGWLWNRGIETLELNADNSREILEKAVTNLKLDIKFDNFLTENYEEYKYYIGQ